MRVIIIKSIKLIGIMITLISGDKAYCAVDQFLNDYFFQNPSVLSQIKQMQLILGNVFVVPKLEFTGLTSLGSGTVLSRVNDSLPYLLSAYRLSENFVVGLNITPSAYGHIDWRPHNSIVSEASTTTRIFYYRIGAQSSYQLSSSLAIGLGFNIAYNKLAELDAVVPNMGNQINKASGVNHTFDLGLFYKIDAQNYLTFAAYTCVDKFGNGTSSLGPITVYDFSLLFTEAAVAYIGLQHVINEKWSMEGKIYWSGWSIGKNVYFINKTNGTSIIPANWSNVLSYQLLSNYSITEKIALFGSLIYETNPVPVATNAIGYPLSGSGAVSLGLDLTLQKNISFQLSYSYGKFIPKARINNAGSRGTISANFQTAVIQFTYKV
jgi:long-subunit fatty acid transport protein